MFIVNCHNLLGQSWFSVESTHLPPLWRGFDFQILRCMWVEFVGSLICSERFFLCYSSFPFTQSVGLCSKRGPTYLVPWDPNPVQDPLGK